MGDPFPTPAGRRRRIERIAIVGSEERTAIASRQAIRDIKELETECLPDDFLCRRKRPQQCPSSGNVARDVEVACRVKACSHRPSEPQRANAPRIRPGEHPAPLPISSDELRARLGHIKEKDLLPRAIVCDNETT